MEARRAIYGPGSWPETGNRANRGTWLGEWKDTSGDYAKLMVAIRTRGRLKCCLYKELERTWAVSPLTRDRDEGDRGTDRSKGK